MNNQEILQLKKRLKDKAIEVLTLRINNSSSAMTEAQSAANEEGKSSAGDKYETSRAMAQNDRDIHARQLEVTQRDLSFVQHIDVGIIHQTIETGALAETDNGIYFFLTGLGPLEIDGKKIIFLSIASPLGSSFSGNKADTIIEFNKKRIRIFSVA